MNCPKKSPLAEWQSRAKDEICVYCGFKGKVTVDHIIPLNIVKTLDPTGWMAYTDEDNFQFLCSACNTFKDNRLDRRNPKTNILMKKYLDLSKITPNQ